MKPSYRKLKSMLSRVVAALETPRDLAEEERKHLIDDAGSMLSQLEAAEPEPVALLDESTADRMASKLAEALRRVSQEAVCDPDCDEQEKEDFDAAMDEATDILALYDATIAAAAGQAPREYPLFRDIFKRYVLQPADFAGGLKFTYDPKDPDADIDMRWVDDEGFVYEAHIIASQARITPDGDHFFVNDSEGAPVRMRALTPVRFGAARDKVMNASGEHVEEPWHVDEGMIDLRDQIPLLAEPGCEWRAIATGAFMNDTERVIALAHPSNAVRIVACVNACSGIPTQALQSVRGAFVDGAAEIKLLRGVGITPR